MKDEYRLFSFLFSLKKKQRIDYQPFRPMINEGSIFPSRVLRSGFQSKNPVDFTLLDDEGRQAIYILNEQSPGRTQHLVLVNNSGQPLRLQPAGANHMPSRANHHFELRFRPGTLDFQFLSWLAIGTGGWRMRVEAEATELLPADHEGIHDGTVSVYLLFVGAEELVMEPGRPLVLILQHVKAAISGGSRGSRMELRYQSDGEELLTAPGAEVACFRQERLQVVNHRGKKELPMLAAFEGSSTVLNNGETENHLVLQISNFLHNSTVALNARDSESPTKFILSFDTSETQAAWALCSLDQAKAIDVEVHFADQQGTNWQIREEFQGNNPQWAITLIDNIEVEVGHFFHLHLEGLKSAMPSGFTTLYLLYENIPGFWDGRFEIPIEKSPLKFDDQKKSEDHREDGSFDKKTNVGIGNTEPVDTLDVNGGVQAETMVLRNGKEENIALDVKGKTVLKSLNVEEKTVGKGAYFSKPEAENFALETNGDVKISGKIIANNLEIDGKVITQGSATKSLEISESLNVGSVKMTESNGALKVAGRLKDSTGFVIPPGGIIMWSGKTVPEGWKLCNGSAGTPDLRGRFIVGYDSGDGNYNQPGSLSEGKTAKGKTGGAARVTLTESQMPSHNHNTKSGTRNHNLLLTNDTSADSENILPDGGLGQKRGTRARPDLFYIEGISSRGGNLPHENRPPYYVLAFIMKK